MKRQPNNKWIEMRTSILKQVLPQLLSPGLQMQLPLDIPDYRRRPKIKPWPVRAAIYFGEEHAWPVTIHHAMVHATHSCV